MPNHLVDVVNDYCFHKLGVLPDLANPKGYNDKVNWLKIHDQMTEQVTCCDKLLVRAYVADRIDRSCFSTSTRWREASTRLPLKRCPNVTC